MTPQTSNTLMVTPTLDQLKLITPSLFHQYSIGAMSADPVALKEISWVKRKRDESEDNSRKKHPVLNGTNTFKNRLHSRQEIQIICTESCFAIENSSKSETEAEQDQS